MRALLQEPLRFAAAGPEPEPALPVVLTVSDSQSPRDAIDALALAAFVSGTQPHATVRELDDVRDDATLVPPAAEVVREVTSPNRARPG